MVKMIILNSSDVDSFPGLIVDSEYFATLCGFHYPTTDYNDIGKAALLRLEADVGHVNGKMNQVYGLLVWHNRVYKPAIHIREANGQIIIRLINERSLPYPIIQVTKSYMQGLEEYIMKKPSKRTCNTSENAGKRVFLQSL